MANHSSAKKAIRQIAKRTAVNKNRITRIRTYLKKAIQAIISSTKEEAVTACIKAQSEIFKGVSHGVVKKNTASRTVSRLSARLKAKA